MRFWVFVVVFVASLFVAAAASQIYVPSFENLRAAKIALSATGLGTQFEATTLAASPESRSIYLPNHGGSVLVTANGNSVQGKKLARISLYESMSMFALPSGHEAAPTKVQFTLSADQNGAGLGPVYIGPTKLLSSHAAKQLRLLAVVEPLIPLALIFAIIATFFLIFFSPTPLRYFYFLLCMMFSVIIESQSQLQIFGLPIRPFISYLGTGYLLAIAMTTNHWWDGPAAERRVAGIVAILLVAMLAVLDIVYGLDAPKTDLPRILIFVVPAAAIAVLSLARATATLRHGGTLPQIAIGFTAIVFTAFLLNLYRQYLTVSEGMVFHIYFMTKCLAAIGIAGLAGSALAHEIGVYRRLRRQVANMATISAGHHFALGEEGRQLKASIELRAVIEERQRFTRDMHDGIGGQLLSLLVKARTGTLDAKVAEAHLSDSINDLRLVTASLDAADSDLQDALAGFAVRADDQLKAVGIALEWEVSPQLDGLVFPPRTTLELLRVMQEAVTNAVRHSDATRVVISVGFDADRSALEIKISDDGKGLPDQWEQRRGKGMRNMLDRANRLLGKLAFSSGLGGAGMAVNLSIPAAANPLG